MILVDTGPLVALFEPRDRDHARCEDFLATVETDLVTTLAVLTEAFHLLDPGARGASALRTFITSGGVSIWQLSQASLARSFELMDRYKNLPMDLADASLVTAAEALKTTRIWTIDQRDFRAYRARIGRATRAFQIVG